MDLMDRMELLERTSAASCELHCEASYAFQDGVQHSWRSSLDRLRSKIKAVEF